VAIEDNGEDVKEE